MRGRRGLSPTVWNRLIVGAWLVGLACVRAGSPEERDPYWQIRAGLENLDGVPLARPDTWSWQPPGGLFYPNSPGWNVVLALSWRSGQFWGLFTVTALAISLCLGGAYLMARTLGAHPLPALAGVTASALLAFPMLNGRATVPAQALLLLALAAPAWWRTRAPKATPAVNGLVAFGAGVGLSTAGNWLHLSWISMAPMVAVAWIVYWRLLDSRSRAEQRGGTGRRCALSLGGSAGLLVGVLLSPYGLLKGLERTVQTQASSAAAILEWISPFTPGAGLRWAPVALIVLGMSASLLLWQKRRWATTGDRPRIALVGSIGVIAVPMALLGLTAIRFLGVAALLLGPFLALLISDLAARARSWALRVSPGSGFAQPARRWTGAHAWRVTLTFVILMLTPGVILLGPVRHAVPPEARVVAELPEGCRLFSDASVSDVAILLRPDVRVWIDGRADYYGAERNALASSYLLGSAPEPYPAGATCVVLQAPDERNPGAQAKARMDAASGWQHRGLFAGFDLWLPAVAAP